MAQAHGENLKQAMDTLRAHKLRSALTVFGVVLGVSVIMLVAALITGLDEAIQEDIKQYGADTAFISRWDQGPHNNTRPLEERLRKPLTLEDAEALKAGCPAVKNVTVYINWWEKPHIIRTKAGEVTGIDFRGVQPNFGEVYANAATLSGRFLSEGDDLHRGKVVMLGENVAPVLFPDGSPVGKDVMIDGEDFQVVGVVEKPKGGFGTDDEDRRVLIPYNTFRKIYPAAYENNDPRTGLSKNAGPGRRSSQPKSCVGGATSRTPRKTISRSRPLRCRCRSSTTSSAWWPSPR